MSEGRDGDWPLKLCLLPRRSAPALRPGSYSPNRDWVPRPKGSRRLAVTRAQVCFCLLAGDQAEEPRCGKGQCGAK